MQKRPSEKSFIKRLHTSRLPKKQVKDWDWPRIGLLSFRSLEVVALIAGITALVTFWFDLGDRKVQRVVNALEIIGSSGQSSLTSAKLWALESISATKLLNNTEKIIIKDLVAPPEARLESANFANAHLKEVELPKARLIDAKFTDAHLDQVDLTGADLTKAVFRNATFKGVKLNKTNLSGSNFTGITVEGIQLNQSDFTTALTPDESMAANSERGIIQRAKDKFLAFIGKEGSTESSPNKILATFQSAYYTEGSPPIDLPQYIMAQLKVIQKNDPNFSNAHKAPLSPLARHNKSNTTF